ncbi:UNVERIFIED_CONTAM: hypothetical protein Sangu_1327400 [Sesamum angustifolium]|uniref:Uncharacterized protein n=1 Tax=Sesamum angustifolium TaxID=2727405 RepID=A0AAW2NKR2_9LAMI
MDALEKEGERVPQLLHLQLQEVNDPHLHAQQDVLPQWLARLECLQKVLRDV